MIDIFLGIVTAISVFSSFVMVKKCLAWRKLVDESGDVSQKCFEVLQESRKTEERFRNALLEQNQLLKSEIEGLEKQLAERSVLEGREMDLYTPEEIANDPEFPLKINTIRRWINNRNYNGFNNVVCRVGRKIFIKKSIFREYILNNKILPTPDLYLKTEEGTDFSGIANKASNELKSLILEKPKRTSSLTTTTDLPKEVLDYIEKEDKKAMDYILEKRRRGRPKRQK
jgi:hypothetical protein